MTEAVTIAPSLLSRIKKVSAPGRIIKSCFTCGAVLYLRPSDCNGQEHHFCDNRCCATWKATRHGAGVGGWHNGTRVSTNGRMKIKVYDHPYADVIGYVYRSRLVMEKQLGRYLLPDEVIHHIDGDCTNDTLANLHLCDNTAAHSRIHGITRGGLNVRSTSNL